MVHRIERPTTIFEPPRGESGIAIDMGRPTADRAGGVRQLVFNDIFGPAGVFLLSNTIDSPNWFAGISITAPSFHLKNRRGKKFEFESGPAATPVSIVNY